MKLSITRPDKYSRTQLLVRVFFGPVYILIPHFFVLIFVLFYSFFVYLYATYYILLKGYHPEYSRRFFTGLFHWLSRLHTRAYHLSDGYPAFGINEEDEYLEFNVDQHKKTDRLQTLVRFVFGPVYILLPHIPLMLLRFAVCTVLAVPAFFIVLFTRQYPQVVYRFQVNSLRYAIRVYLYFFHLEKAYPPFHGKPVHS